MHGPDRFADLPFSDSSMVKRWKFDPKGNRPS